MNFKDFISLKINIYIILMYIFIISAIYRLLVKLLPNKTINKNIIKQKISSKEYFLANNNFQYQFTI